MKEFKLQVCGRDVTINYETERVDHPDSTPDDIMENINNYLLEEGFLDDSFIAMMKSK